MAAPVIVYAEDVAAARRVTSSALRARGFEVHDFPEGAAALQKILELRKGGQDVILITDLDMTSGLEDSSGGMDGLPLLRALRQMPLPVIITSSDVKTQFSASAGKIPFEDVEVDATLAKPYSPERTEVISAVDFLMEKYFPGADVSSNRNVNEPKSVQR